MIKQIGFLLILSCGLAYAQRPQGMVEAEAVCFARDSNTVSLELYYSIQQGALTFHNTGNHWTADIPVIAEVWQEDKRIAVRASSKQFSFEGTKEQLQAKANDIVLDVASFEIPAKKNTVAYLIYHGKDYDGKELFDTLRRLTYVPVVKEDTFVFSGVELGSSLQSSENTSHLFHKVGYIILPNPSLIFGGEYSSLAFYTELNVPRRLPAADSVQMTIRILDGAQNEIIKRTQNLPLIAPRTPFLGTVNIDGLSTDSYSLLITAAYKGNVIATIRKGFFFESGIIVSEDTDEGQPVVADDETIYQTSEISKYSDLELSEKIAQSAYIMPNDVRKAIDKTPNMGEKKRMLYKYWRSKDEPGTRPLSEFRNFNIRVEEANRLFTYQKTIGWKSSRGRIFIVYGPPEFVGGEPFSTESKPYIIWDYYSRRFPLSSGSKAEFVFVDLYGGGNFQLVHSNVRGEVSQPDWYSNQAFRLR